MSSVLGVDLQQQRFSGARLKAARLNSGYTLTKLAAEVDRSPFAFRNWEQERSRPSIDVAWRLAQILDLPLDSFFEPVPQNTEASMT
jgi:transcriptional regulator with XRE-family HTH domain